MIKRLFPILNDILMSLEEHGVNNLLLLEKHVEALAPFVEKLQPTEVRVGAVSILVELRKVVNTLKGLISSIEDDEISEKRKKEVLSLLQEHIVRTNSFVSQKISRDDFVHQFHADEAKFKKFKKLRDAYSEYLNSTAEDEHLDSVKRGNQKLKEALDNDTITKSVLTFRRDKDELFCKLNSSKHLDTYGMCGVRTTIAIKTVKPLNPTRVQIAGLDITYIRPIWFIRNQLLLAYLWGEDDSEDTFVLPKSKELAKLEGIDPTTKYVDVMASVPGEASKRIVCKGIAGIKFIWLLPSKTRDLLGELNVLEVSLPV